MGDNLRHVINMANSIIGVSILSMPYCFKEVGLVLGVLLLIFCGFITKKTCMFLVRSAIMARRRSYELLAFQVFGVTGKLFMELCMILFLLGICISFHVVIGDLAPAIVAKYMLIENSASLRCTLLIGMVLLVILPLCLLRNIESLASISACSIGFYVILNTIMFYVALPRLLAGDWIHKADLFHFEKIFSVLPIMLLALACQSNVFEIYGSIPDPDVHKMQSVVNQAANICCALYIGVGFLGYVAFYDKDIGGNIIMSFPNSNLTDGITMFFVISLALSFPLMLFPCRTSLHSLIYKRNVNLASYDSFGNFIPESRFKIITISTLIVSLVIGILIPNIEFVLGLLGSTMGMWIALLLPSIFYIRVYTKLSFDRLLAQVLLFLGLGLMITGTYIHLTNFRVNTQPVTVAPLVPKGVPVEIKNPVVVDVVPPEGLRKEVIDLSARKEPAIPEPPAPAPPPEVLVQKETIPGAAEVVVEAPKPGLENARAKIPEVPNEEPSLVKKVKEENLHPDAIKKEEKEQHAEEKEKEKAPKEEVIEKKQEEILKKLEQHQKEQVKILEAQKEILQELKDQKDEMKEVREENIAIEGVNAPLNNPVQRKSDDIEVGDISDDHLQQQQLNIEHPPPPDHLNIDELKIVQAERHPDRALNKVEANQKIDNMAPIAQNNLLKEYINPLNGVRGDPNDKNIAQRPSKPNLHLKPISEKDSIMGLKDGSDRVRDNLDAANPPADPQLVKFENIDPQNLAKHDEERRKRDVDAVVAGEEPRIANAAMQLPEADLQMLNFDVKKEGSPPVYVAYDSRRQLLWNQRKTRRRKKRNDQYPEYWEEM